MANRRMISKSISVSRKLSKISTFEALLFTWLIPHCDDYGRMDALPQLVKGIVVPVRPEGADEVAAALDTLEKVGLIRRYIVNDEQYLEIYAWTDHQTFRTDRPKTSLYPSREGKIEIDQQTEHVTAEVYRRDGYKCRYCGAEDTDFEIDHVVPVSKGGETALENLVVSCRKCNQKKKGRTPEEAGMSLAKPMTYQRHPQAAKRHAKVREDKGSEDNNNGGAGVEDAFDAFWSAYPRRVNKVGARRAWARLAPDARLQGSILLALDSHKRSEQWAKDDGRFIPHPATWLNQRRWEDDLKVAKGPAGGGKFDNVKSTKI